MTNRDALLSAVCLLCLSVPASAQVAGVTAAVNQSATGLPPSGTIRTVVLGDNIVRNERIDTNSIGLVQILLADGTAFTVGPDSSVTIDSFVYDPDAGTAQVAATMTRGVLRFIGGRTSKTPNGVSLATPIGTVGIRGAVVDVNLVGSTSDSCGLPAHIDLVFGKEVTLSGNGAPARVYQPGYSIVADGRQGRRVQRTPPGCASLVQAALAGRPGTTGGASDPPTETVVAQSPIGAENSARPIFVNAPPIPTARPVNPNTVDTILVADATFDLVRIRIAQGLPPVEQEPEPPVVEPEPPVVEPEPEPPVVEPPVVEPPVEPEPEPPVIEPEPEPPVVDPEPPVEPPVVPPVEPPADPGPVTFNVYQNDPERDSESGPEIGAVSNTPTLTTATAEGVADSGGRLIGTLGEEAIPYELPLYTDEAGVNSGGASVRQENFSAPTSGGALEPAGPTFGGQPLVGDVYVGSEGFRAYLLRTAGFGSDGEGSAFLAAVPPPALFYAVTGTPTPIAGVFGTGMVSQYAIDDRQTGGLFASPILTDFLVPEAGTDTDLFIVGTASGPRMLQSWVVIDSAGSSVGVNIGTLTQPSGEWIASGLHRGGERIGSEEYRTAGTFGSLNGPTGSGVFGSTGDYLVLSGEPGNPEPFAETGATFSYDVPYTDTHVLSRSAPSATPIASGAYLGRYEGYAAGLVREPSDDESETFDVLQRNANPASVFLNFGSDGSVRGTFAIAASSNGDTTATFGASDGSSSTVVDNNRYAAVGPDSSYMLSGRANPENIGGNPAFDLCETCDFIQWGWWGTTVVEQSGGTIVSQTNVHLGNYVTGAVSSRDAYDTFADAITASETTQTVATYAGNAVGTVVRTDPELGIAGATATGTFTLGWNFGSDEGGMDLTFDGQRFIADLNLRSDGTTASFNGTGAQPIPESPLGAVFGTAISVDGSFVGAPNGPLGGVIGSFGANTETWQGNGVFGGAQRGELGPPGTIPVAPLPSS